MNNLIAKSGSLTVLLNNFKNTVFKDLNVMRIGIVQDFDSIKQTATIQLVDKIVFRKFDGTETNTQDYAPLVDCPIFMPYSNNGGLTFSINKGDECVVMFNDRDIDNWFSSGSISEPNTSRFHSFSDAIAFIGIKSMLHNIKDYNNNATTISYQKSKIQLTDKIHLANATQNFKTLLDLLISYQQLLVTTLSNAKVFNPITQQYDLTFDPTTMSTLTTLTNNLMTLQNNFNLLLI